jgi:hypothetical protein
VSEEKVNVNLKYKDRLFNFIYGSPENRKWTLSLYNAVNSSDYKDEDKIEFNTIKEALYLGMHNDTSFLISDIISIFEHQASYNPNMPVRMLQYLGHLYEGYIIRNKLNKFGSALLELPVPKLVVFYNGLTDVEDEVILKLSDSFPEELRQESDVEITVRMININYGHSKALLEACSTLKEYAWLVGQVRNYGTSMELEKAVNLAINEMPTDFELKSFLVAHRSEVLGMLLTEYNEAEVMELFKEEGRKEGADNINTLYTWLFDLGRDEDVRKAAKSPSVMEALFKEYNDCHEVKLK